MTEYRISKERIPQMPRPKRLNKRHFALYRKNNFTLNELLIVLVIVLLIMALTFPTISAVKSKSREVHCVNNQRQIGMAFIEFMKDNRGQEELINADDGWSTFLYEYINSGHVYICPEDDDPNNSSDISNYYVDIRQTTYHLTFTDGPFSRIYNHDDLQVDESGQAYYRVWIDRRYGSTDPNHYTDYPVNSNEFILALEDIHNSRSDMDFNDLVIKFTNSQSNHIRHVYEGDEEREITHVYVAAGQSVLAGSPLFRTDDGVTHYSNILGTITRVNFEVGDRIGNGNTFLEGDGGGYDAYVLEKNAGYTYDLYKEGHGQVISNLRGDYEFQIVPSRATSYGVNMAVNNVFMSSEKIFMIDYPNKRVIYSGLELGGVNTGEIDDWSKTSWDKNNDGKPDFARHRDKVNAMMGDMSIRSYYPDDIDPLDSFNAEKYWE